MNKVCKQCGQEFEVTDEDRNFYKKVSPVFGGRKFQIPLPTLCSDCRQQRRWAFRNQSKLYRRKCDFSGEEMISLYSPDKPYKIYKEDIWWSDKWDPIDYGRDFDFKRPFFEQFGKLLLDVPRRGMHQDGTNEGCEYITFGMSNKNCYLVFASFYCEDVYFSTLSGMLKDSMDCFLCAGGELLYECVNCRKIYNSAYLKDCQNCSDSYFLEDCRNCQNCISCKNLRNKKHHIYNQPVSKEEYLDFKNRLLEEGFDREKVKFDKWKLDLPCICTHIENSEDCTGDYIENSKNCYECFDVVIGAKDLRYCQFSGWNGKDMMDCSMCGKEVELLYEMHATVGSHRCAFTNFCRGCSDVYYCDCVSSCQNCFGCSGLKHKKYCILNKQYSKEEYDELVLRIIDHMKSSREWGEFFPVALSPFAYNETIANEYFSLTREEAIEKGFKWKNFASGEPKRQTEEVLVCEECGKNYKNISQESKLLKRFGFPIPKKCPDCRHIARMNSRNSHKLWERKCMKCGKDVKTSYSPEGPEIIFCKECYLKEVY